MSMQAIGPVLDGLGVTLDLDDGDLIASALVIAKVVGPDGSVSLHLADSQGLSWIDQMGLLASAQNVVQMAPFTRAEED